MANLNFAFVRATDETVWRVGRAPDPWAWADPEFAGNNRWDDAQGFFRTMYAGASVFACFVEVLAFARPDVDASGQDPLNVIIEDPDDALEFPVADAGKVPLGWISARMVSCARLHGTFVDVYSAATIARLRPAFVQVAIRLGFPDFDASALKSSSPRKLTQQVASYLYQVVDKESYQLVDGVRFSSRHGDDLLLWAIFERPGDEPASRKLRRGGSWLVDPTDSELLRAMQLHGLTWV